MTASPPSRMVSPYWSPTLGFFRSPSRISTLYVRLPCELTTVPSIATFCRLARPVKAARAASLFTPKPTLPPCQLLLFSL
jgi:hypothetical protein